MKIQFLAIVIGNALLASTGAVLMRYSGKDLDWSHGLAGVMSTGKLWLTGMFIGWIAGLTYAVLLTKHDLITTTVVNIALYFTFVTLAGHFLLGEHFSLVKFMGTVLAFLGVCLLI